MKILTAAEMRAVDALTIAAGMPGIVLMENAGCRVVEVLEREYAPLDAQRIVVICGKGNNGGDGLVIARQLHMRHPRAALSVVLAEDPSEFRGDAATNWTMLQSLGITASREIEPRMRAVTLVIDALLGTGLNSPARGRALDLIREMNDGFPGARIVSVDVPSGLHADGESVRAELTVTLAAWKTELALPPTCDRADRVVVVPIGIPSSILNSDAHRLNLSAPDDFAALFVPRAPSGHKGTYGHVLVVGGAQGKGGAAAMSGAAALRAGAGLVTVAADARERATITSFMPELMSAEWSDELGSRDVLAIGPGLGTDAAAVQLVRDYFAHAPVPAVVDADALNALAGTDWHAPAHPRILTPHPGEMARLTGLTTAEVQRDRVGVARKLATERACTVVLKGQRTVIACADGCVYINPTGTPAMGTAGSGDILTGLIAGLIAQHPADCERATRAAVWLHGRAGEIGARELGEQSLTATDLLRYLSAAMNELRA